jgi:hypothetical protein
MNIFLAQLVAFVKRILAINVQESSLAFHARILADRAGREPSDLAQA